MISLAIDTSGTVCAACIYDSEQDNILGKKSEDIGRGHAEHLMEIISAAMREAKVDHEQLDRIVTCIGPGSFTGVRVGVATARGFGLGLKIPVIGISSLHALIEAAKLATKDKQGETCFGAVQSAGRGDVYCQFTFNTEFGTANTPMVLPLEKLQASSLIQTFGLILCGTAVQEFEGIQTCQIETSPSMHILAKLGSAMDFDGSRPEPLYLRKPDAKPQQGFAVARQDT